MRILVIEDEEDLAYLIKKGLEEEKYSVDVCYDGVEGLYMAEEVSYDAMILDVMLPGLDGIAVLKSLRAGNIPTPVLMLTARDALEDKIKGLDTGADDYLTKPFEFRELLARIRSLLRRNAPQKSAVFKIEDLELDTAMREVSRGGEKVRLTVKEYMILEYLVYNRQRVVSRSDIVEHVYDDTYDRDSNVIDVHINSLRKKLNQGHEDQLISTVRGAGYILRKEQ